MNERFVNVKVDREERPDLDAVYMDAVVALTGQGGWPMTVFLTPDGEPFFGGTATRPSRGTGCRAFRQVLTAVAEAYRERRDEVRRAARPLVEAAPAAAAGSSRPHEPLDRVARCARRSAGSRSRLRPASGAASAARRSSRRPRRSSSCCAAASSSWSRRRSTGMAARRDVRPASAAASTATRSTSSWLVPHFEKMLYDNALLAAAYLHGWLVTGQRALPRGGRRRRVELHAARAARSTTAGSPPSQDADTDGVEGLTFTWAPGEGAPDELLEPFEDGRFDRSAASSTRRLRGAAASSCASSGRSRARDDKAIASWNGLCAGRSGRGEEGARARRSSVGEAAPSASSC